ncbi:MAG: sugar nucleotide-binding protein [bacterium]|nr:sugar nucleotide-binding protein [bacterium]
MKKKILVIGASGYVGARIYSDLSVKYDVVGTYFGNKQNDDLIQIDIANIESVRKIMGEVKPDFIVQVAAFPVNPMTDEQKKLVQQVNYVGMDNVVKVSNELGIKLVFISSAVAEFKGNSYGDSKAYGENVCKNVIAGSLIVRPHTVFGYSPNMTNDRSFNRILKNIFLQTPAVYDTSWKFMPTYIGHMSMVIEKYVEGEINNGIMNVAMDTIKSKFDLGYDILKNFNIEVTPIDNKIDWPLIKLDLTDFNKLNLPIKSYDEMILKMVEEIKSIN